MQRILPRHPYVGGGVFVFKRLSCLCTFVLLLRSLDIAGGAMENLTITGLAELADALDMNPVDLVHALYSTAD